ncbi:MAG TPA: hypothetical protein VHD83_18805 [Puia sp.]|nr:hypothetical protein [Puia sp.]
MNTKFTILVAAGLLFAGVSQAQGTVASEFNNKPRHAVAARPVVKKEFKKAPHHKMNRHHKVKHHHRKMRHGKPGRH